MQVELKLLKKFEYTIKEWRLIKFFTVLFWLLSMWKITTEYDSQPFPEGICHLVNCAFFALKPVNVIVLSLAVIASLAYVFDKFKIIALSYIVLCSLILLSLERSNGILDRQELWSMIFIAQLAATLRYHFSENYFTSNNISLANICMFYSIQMVAAAYTVAGITKLQESGIHFITDAPNLIFQLKRMEYQVEIDFGWNFFSEYYYYVEHYLLRNKWLTAIAFSIALAIELLAIISCLGKKYAYWYGWLLILLHIGIAMTTLIFIPIYVILFALYFLGITRWMVKSTV